MEQKRVFLLGRARSGTTVFRRMLHTHPDVRAYSEILNSNAKNNYFEYLQRRLTTEPKLCYPEHSVQLFIDFVERLSTKGTMMPVTIFDLKFECLHTVYKPWRAALDVPAVYEIIRDNNWYMIHLTRNNHVRRLLSNARAVSSGVYHVQDPGAQAPPSMIKLPTDRMLEKFKAFDDAYDQVRETFKNNPRYLEFDYEDLFEEDGLFRPDVIEKAGAFLELDDQFEQAPRQSKVTPKKLADTIENFDEIKALLRRTPYAHFLRETKQQSLFQSWKEKLFGL